MKTLKFDFTGCLDDLRTRYGCRLRRLAAFYFWQVDCLTHCKLSLQPPQPVLISSKLDPRRALRVLHWPIRVIRIVTDPVVDTIFFLMSVLVLPSITRLLGGSLNTVQWVLSGIVPGNTFEKSAHLVITMVPPSLFSHMALLITLPFCSGRAS